MRVTILGVYVEGPNSLFLTLQFLKENICSLGALDRPEFQSIVQPDRQIKVYQHSEVVHIR